MSLGPQFAEVMQNLPGGDALGTFNGDAQALGTGRDQARFIAQRGRLPAGPVFQLAP
jgi:hypothetical protein